MIGGSAEERGRLASTNPLFCLCILFSEKRRIFLEILGVLTYFGIEFLAVFSEYKIAESPCKQVVHSGIFADLPSGSLLMFCLLAGILINKMFLHWSVEGQLMHLVFHVTASPHPCLWALGCDSCILLPEEAGLRLEKSAVRELSECRGTSCSGGEDCWKLSSRQN